MSLLDHSEQFQSEAPPNGGATASSQSNVALIDGIQESTKSLSEARENARLRTDSPFAPLHFLTLKTLVETQDSDALTEIREFIETSEDDALSRLLLGQAIDLLAQVNGNGADTLLYEYLNDPRDVVVIRATKALETRGDSAPMSELVSNLNERLSDPDGGVRSRVAQRLGQLGSAAAIPALEASIGDENSEVRMRAAQALGRIGGDTAAELVVRLLNDPVKAVRESAARSLDQLRRQQDSDPT